MSLQRRIGYEIRSVSNQVKICIDQTVSRNKTQGVTGMQSWIIRYLYRHPDSFQHDLETEFNIRRSTATGLLQRMERDGLLVRETAASDARRKKITLTPKATGIHEGVMRAIDEVEERITSGLTGDEIDTFISLLEKIKRNIE